MGDSLRDQSSSDLSLFCPNYYQTYSSASACVPFTASEAGTYAELPQKSSFANGQTSLGNDAVLASLRRCGFPGCDDDDCPFQDKYAISAAERDLAAVSKNDSNSTNEFSTTELAVHFKNDNTANTFVVPFSSVLCGQQTSTFSPTSIIVSQEATIFPSNPTIPHQETSINYMGNRNNPANLSANIPNSENTSVFVTNLPPDITYTELFRALALRPCGRIFATHINEADIDKGHMFSAAKIVFFTKVGARTFLELGLTIRGLRARIVPNRIRVAEPQIPQSHTRVLHITGPAHLVSIHNLREVFKAHKLEHQDEEIIIHPASAFHPPGWNNLEWRFASYRCQAAIAKRIIETKYRKLGMYVRFGLDPCDPLAIGF